VEPIPADDKPLRDSLGCSPFVDHHVEVHEGDGVDENKFVALFQFKWCQKYLRITQDMSAEFVAMGLVSRFLRLFSILTTVTFITAGRIWWLRIYYDSRRAEWLIVTGLSQPSIPARPKGVIIIEPRREAPGCATRPQALRKECRLVKYTLLAPRGWV